MELARAYGDVPVYVLSTYTALYPLADLLKRRAHDNEPAAMYRPSVS
jgi:lipid II isoglutaminyl synthase (glutamine-hydrolysing)